MDSLDLNADTTIDNKERKSAQDPERNLHLLIKTDDWAASLALLLSWYIDNKNPDSRNQSD